jgi:hypothetical protein
MAKNVARYRVSYGLSGCYMPDSVSGPVEFDTRKTLADFIRSEIETYEMPAKLFREVKLRKLWSFIARNGSSVAHFSLHHGANVLHFEGLTEAEFQAAEASCD